VAQKFHFAILRIEVTHASRGLSAIAELLVTLHFASCKPVDSLVLIFAFVGALAYTTLDNVWVVFPAITGSFPTNVITHLHGLSMDLTDGRTVGPTVDSTVG